MIEIAHLEAGDAYASPKPYSNQDESGRSILKTSLNAKAHRRTQKNVAKNREKIALPNINREFVFPPKAQVVEEALGQQGHVNVRDSSSVELPRCFKSNWVVELRT
ncbi:unnamed protein product [Phytophthora fragariaefolia]|uniref:Unnamed protein product n=1 Tax=Phytophthora fragariaefolia TaxID=1490495 RepID=A0A9W7CU21_9STRA|nr:unnamed protein product [Phytophthora fragariaefolia]